MDHRGRRWRPVDVATPSEGLCVFGAYIGAAELGGLIMTFKAGQYVRHAKYGNGTIVERDEERTTVDFDAFGLKKFVTSIAAFEAAEGVAPKRKRVGGKRRAKAAAAVATAEVE